MKKHWSHFKFGTDDITNKWLIVQRSSKGLLSCSWVDRSDPGQIAVRAVEEGGGARLNHLPNGGFWHINEGFTESPPGVSPAAIHFNGQIARGIEQLIL